MAAPRLILFGKQGAGKGTQAALIVEKYQAEHLSTGDIFRAAIREGTPAGKEAQTYIDRGELVPDDTVVKVVNEKFESSPELLKRGFVLDGFPRTDFQARALEELLRELHSPLHCAINIDVARDVVLHRLTGRRICVNCGTIYHVDHPPQKDWICDRCGGSVEQRADDSEDAINRRLDLYEKETAPLLSFYEERNLLEVVDGIGTAEEVFQRISDVIHSRVSD